MEAGGQKEKRKKKTFVCIYLDVDKGKRRKKKHRGEQEGGKDREKVILLVLTRGSIACREIAVYCFCDRENVNWPSGCLTSPRVRGETKWTQTPPGKVSNPL